MKKWILLLVVFTVFIGKSHAGLLLEPYVGTIFNTTQEFGGTDQDVTGTSYGARLGFQTAGLMLGLDYQMATPKIDNVDTDNSLTNYGIFIGYELPVMLRLWATYVMSGSYSLTGDWVGATAGDEEVKFTKVTGTKIGIGYKVMPFVSLNLEVMSLAYKSAELDGVDVSSSFTDSSGNSLYLFSLSFPLSI